MKTSQNTFTHCDHLLVSPNHALRQEKAVKINSILDMKYWFQLASNLFKAVLIITEEQQY